MSKPTIDTILLAKELLEINKEEKIFSLLKFPLYLDMKDYPHNWTMKFHSEIELIEYLEQKDENLQQVINELVFIIRLQNYVNQRKI